MSCENASHVVIARTLLHKTDHFAEAYIEGREFHLALLERVSGVEVLPIAEILFGALASHANKIYSYDAKWTPDSAAYIGTLRRFGLEQDEPELAKTLKQLALAAWTHGVGARWSFRSGWLGLGLLLIGTLGPISGFNPSRAQGPPASTSGLGSAPS